MKRFVGFFLFLLLSFFSSTANAYLIEGTWNSDSGDTELAMWTANYSYGTPQGYAEGGYSETHSLTGQYDYTGVVVGMGQRLDGYINGGIYYLPMYTKIEGEMSFNFYDGLRYTVEEGTMTANYTAKFNFNRTYLGLDGDIEFIGKAPINDNGIDYILSSYFIGNETNFVLDSSGRVIEHNGVYSFVEFNIASVPIPSAILLFSSGFVGLIGYKKLWFHA